MTEKEIRRVATPNGMDLFLFSTWLMEEFDLDPLSFAKGLTICLVGSLLFPSSMFFLHRSSLGMIRELWRGRSISQAVLAFLHSGLTTASIGQRLYGSMIILSLWMDIHLHFRMGDAPTTSRIFQTSTAFLFKSLISLKTAFAPLAHLKTRFDWREFFKTMPSRHFLFVPCYMENKVV